MSLRWHACIGAWGASDYEVVQSTNDPNTLAVFLGHGHYHVEGLLTLAMVFAHTGE